MAVFRWAALAFSGALMLPCSGKEIIYLRSGFHLDAKSHTQEQQKLILYTDSGSLELPAADVDRIEVIAEDPAVLPTATPKSQPAEKPFNLLTNAATLQGIEPELVRSVARVESGLRQDAISPKGALGLMQLMPRTARELGVEAKLAQENAQGGAKYLRDLLFKYGGAYVLALAAYNAGPGTVAKYGGVPPYAETQRYILNVLREYYRQKQETHANHIAGK